MEAGFYALAALSVFYYFLLVWKTKRINSTFSWFWLAYSILNVLLGIVVTLVPTVVDYLIVFVSAFVTFVFAFVELLILCAMVALPKENLDYIIVLGAQVRGKTICGSLKRRLDKGVHYLEQNPNTLCIVSGGRGKGEDISEAEAMAEYLKGCGVDENRIIMEDRSTTTWENLKFSAPFILDIEKDKIGIVSNNFHIYRAMKMARVQGFKKVYALPATTDMIMFPNYMVREFFAFFIMFFEMRSE